MADTIELLIERAARMRLPEPRASITVVIDLDKAAKAGCDLGALLTFPDADFVHDWMGIISYTNRDDLTSGFLEAFQPRCTRAGH